MLFRRAAQNPAEMRRWAVQGISCGVSFQLHDWPRDRLKDWVTIVVAELRYLKGSVYLETSLQITTISGSGFPAPATSGCPGSWCEVIPRRRRSDIGTHLRTASRHLMPPRRLNILVLTRPRIRQPWMGTDGLRTVYEAVVAEAGWSTYAVR